MSDLATILYNISEQDVYVYTEFDILDFTSPKYYNCVICTNSKKIEFTLDVDENKFKENVSALQALIGGENNYIFSWNIKNLYSYIKGRTGLDFKFNGKLIDLYFFESYLNGNLEKPKTFNEFKSRFLKHTKDPLWNNAFKIYNEVYQNLIFTICDLESNFLIDKIKKSKVNSLYQLDGQVNGRLKCFNGFSRSYNAHTLTEDDKNNLRLPCFDGVFVSFDYKNMEVAVLQWLSQDPLMGEMLQGNDFYEELWKKLIPQVEFNLTHRKTCKDIFLPLFYGIGIDSLVKKINWPKNQVIKIVDKIHNFFPSAFSWIESKQKHINNNICVDDFGRRREFDELYKIRNFVIQSPASLICMDRLNKLNNNIKKIAKVCMSIHDGYVLYCDKKVQNKVCIISKEILESSSDFYKDLKLKTVCSVGDNLNSLSEFKF